MFIPTSAFVFAMPLIPQGSRPRRQSAATQRNNGHALAKGWPPVAVRLMQTYQHLTVCTMQLTSIYLLLSAYFYLTRDTGLDWARCGARLILPAAGSIVAHFWTFVLLFGPFSIADREDFPADEEKTNRMVRRLFYRPSMSASCLFYILMHVQHTWMPLLPWFEGAVFPSEVMCPPSPFSKQLLLSAGFLLSWLSWALFVWAARNNPPYPIMRTVWRDGTWTVLYAGMVFQAVASIAVSRMVANF